MDLWDILIIKNVLAALVTLSWIHPLTDAIVHTDKSGMIREISALILAAKINCSSMEAADVETDLLNTMETNALLAHKDLSWTHLPSDVTVFQDWDGTQQRPNVPGENLVDPFMIWFWLEYDLIYYLSSIINANKSNIRSDLTNFHVLEI